MIIWPAPAKINLFLYITGRRYDGYHNLQTIFQFLNYGDKLEIIPTRNGKIELLTPLQGVPEKKNLIIRAAQELQHTAKLCGTLPSQAGVKIALRKYLPIGGGLGGGSSDAATVLIVLNHLWQTKFSEDMLVNIGFKLGADVPIFIRGRATFAEDDKLQPIELPEKWYLVAYPGVSISTTDLFNDPELTRNSPTRALNKLLHSPFYNDCETLARKRFPKVNELLSWLVKYAPSRLTGTGSCVFAEFHTAAEAHQVLKLTPKWIHSFVACGINISPLHHIISKL